MYLFPTLGVMGGIFKLGVGGGGGQNLIEHSVS